MRNLFLPIFILCFGACTSPAPSTDTLPRSSPEQQGISSAGVRSFVNAADDEIDTMNSFMLLRHGFVVAEGWWDPYGPENPHMLYSLSKSFTSTAVGLAINEGHFSIDDKVVQFFPDEAPAELSDNLNQMRVHDLLRMSAGHEEEVSLRTEESWIRAFLAHPVPFIPGTHFQYNTPATYMLSAIVQKTTGVTVLEYLQSRLFEPLGIENPAWGTSPEGIILGGYGLSIRTEDIARFGQLYLQNGVWNGEELIPLEWVAAATSLQTSNGSNPESDWNQGYGYQFWRSRHNTYRGDGAFGQYCIVMPEQDVVVAITSGVRDMQSVLDLIWDKLLPAIKDEALPEEIDDWQQLETRLSNLQVRPIDGRPTAPTASTIGDKRYVFSENGRGIEAVSFDFAGETPALVVSTGTGDSRIPYGNDTWIKGRASFVNGFDRIIGFDADYAVAATGNWTGDSTLSIKLCLYETPYYTTMDFHFDGDEVGFESSSNVSFGPTMIPRIVGRAR